EPSMSEVNRREFVILATAAVAGCAMCDFASAAAATQPAGGTVEVGAKSDYAKDGVFDKFAKDQKIFVIRNEGKIYATTATCTHRRATLKLGKDGTITCPNHGSKFSNYGTPTKGPAKISLIRY